MKTVVVGLFEEMADARRVLEQIADSPLDLDAVTVLHRDARAQEDLRQEVGLPPRRALVTALMLGALTGAVAGLFLGAGALAALGPLLAAGVGALAGGTLGAALAAAGDASRLPPHLNAELVEAVAAGATAVSVRTANLPTARAVRDLFEAGGSRHLGPPEAGAGEPRPGPEAADPLFPSAGDAWSAAEDSRPAQSEEHALFAPPWRRTPFAARPRGGYVDDPPTPVVPPAPSEDDPEQPAGQPDESR